MNYFEIPAVSNSLLNRVDTFEKHNINPSFWRDKTKKIEGDAIDIGVTVDELVSNEINLHQIAYIDHLLEGFTSKEKEFIEKALTMIPFEAYITTYDNKETRDCVSSAIIGISAGIKVAEKADELFNRAKPYYDAVEETKDMRIVSKEVYDTVLNCYNALMFNQEFISLYDVGIEGFVQDIETFKQLEIYWKCNDLDCKSKLDLLRVNWDTKEVFVCDLKTHSQALKGTIKKKNYIRQLSFYAEAVRFWLLDKGLDDTEFVFRYFIVGVHTQYYSVSILEICEYDIFQAHTGGCYKPDFFPLGKPLNYYLSGSQKSMLRYNEIWDEDSEDEFKTRGWGELLQLYKDKYAKI